MGITGVTSFLERQAERLAGWPWIVRVALGVAAVAVGVLVLVRPFDSLTVLLALIAVALLVDGLARIAAARAAATPVLAIGAGVAEVVGGVLVVVLPLLAVSSLPIIVGVVLMISGVVDLATAWSRREHRVANAVLGVALLVLGVLAIVWPDVALLVIAVVFAIRLIGFGIAAIVRAVRERKGAAPSPTAERRIGWIDVVARVALLAFAAVALAGSVVLHRGVAQPGAFYTPPAQLPAEPGQILRLEPYTQAVPDGARGWLMLYSTTDLNGEMVAGSAFVMAPEHPGPDPLDVVLWTHGTQGADATCAPTLLPEPLPITAPAAAMHQQLALGRVLVGPDYPGMGTPGPQGYLIGENEGRSSLDAVRAAHQIPGLTISPRTVVWGHSQGGQAALWTGGLAAQYAPELDILGVSAAAPAADVKGLIGHLGESFIGQVLGPYAVRAYSETYDDVSARHYIDPRMFAVYEAASRRCIPNSDEIVSVLTALTMHGQMYRVDPSTGPLGDRLDENVPTLPIDAPLFIAQGLTDPLILPAVQQKYVADRCAAGQALLYREYEGRDHLGVVADDSPYSADLLAWTDDRFAGVPQSENSCP